MDYHIYYLEENRDSCHFHGLTFSHTFLKKRADGMQTISIEIRLNKKRNRQFYAYAINQK